MLAFKKGWRPRRQKNKVGQRGTCLEMLKGTLGSGVAFIHTRICPSSNIFYAITAHYKYSAMLLFRFFNRQLQIFNNLPAFYQGWRTTTKQSKVQIGSNKTE